MLHNSVSGMSMMQCMQVVAVEVEMSQGAPFLERGCCTSGCTFCGGIPSKQGGWVSRRPAVERRLLSVQCCCAPCA